MDGVSMTKVMRLRHQFRRAAQSGAIKPWMLVVLLLALAPLLTLGFYEGRKAYWDAKVREMCAKDGGIKVYETVRLPPEKFNEWGQPNFFRPDQGEDALGVDYVFKKQAAYYRRGNPEMWRAHIQVIRRIDEKTLGESTSYSRRGGDLPGPVHDSSFGCPEERGDIPLLMRIFKQKPDRK
ncbi:hypothetical protein ACNQFN_22325 [Thauera butanivorans]|uniref:hypothetical protein n=1 Tax=Thauera butanivorans TaxID=86174 RepID=UPI003AB51B55